jgi:hypothetical protein
MKNTKYWMEHYVIESVADEVESKLRFTSFHSTGKKFELIYFFAGKETPNVLISPGSGGHAYVFAELAYQINLRGYNTFIMPKHGGYTIPELMKRHEDALVRIATEYNNRIGVFAEGLGGYATFYLSLISSSFKSAVYQNAPVIATEKQFHNAFSTGNGSAKRRKLMLPLAKLLFKIFPKIRLPILLYLDFKEMIDTKPRNRIIEQPLIDHFSKDPEFDKYYPLSAIMSLVDTQPPNPLSMLKIPTMFIIPERGFFPGYQKDLYSRLPNIKKKIALVDGSVFWMLSNPKEASGIICDWFDETL